MAYRFISGINLIIQMSLLDYIQEPTEVIIDLMDGKGRQFFKKMYGREPSIDPVILSDYINKEKKDFEIISKSINEKSRRLLAGYIAKRKGVKKASEITSLDLKTIQKGKNEINSGNILPKGKIRKNGGGRLKFEVSEPRFLDILEHLIENEIAGDPMTTRIWTRKTLRWIKIQLIFEDISVSISTIRKGLKKLGISLRKNKKYVNTRNHPDRNTQFNYIKELKADYTSKGLPIISVDCKKKEKIGNFKNAGRKLGKKAKKVLDHDFPSDAEGKLIPYGIYDVIRNLGYVFCGKSHETSEFAVDAILWWWRYYGRKNFPNAKNLLILADCGTSNGYRTYKWKYDLKTRFAEKYNIEITVAHYPPGCSKYNPIEHRLFSFISKNWEGEPLTSYEKALGFIRTTRTRTGLRVSTTLTNKEYKTKLTVPKEVMDSLEIIHSEICPLWNYTIMP